MTTPTKANKVTYRAPGYTTTRTSHNVYTHVVVGFLSRKPAPLQWCKSEANAEKAAKALARRGFTITAILATEVQ